MEVNYRSKIFLLVLGLLCTGLSIAEIYDKGLMLFDYEGFDPIVCFWLEQQR